MNQKKKALRNTWLIILQVYLAISASNVSSIINHNVRVMQVFIIRSFFLEASKWQPNAGFSVMMHDRP